MLFLGCDHAGFALKEKLAAALSSRGVLVKDLTPKLVAGDDYPDVARAVCLKTLAVKGARGVLVCGSGLGMCIAANKLPGVRAAVLYSDAAAVASRRDNDANVACFGGRTMKARDATRRLALWLSTPFSREARHRRRLKKIAALEKARA